MSGKEALDDIKTLSQTKENRSQTARLSELYEAIEAELEKGVRREVILSSLQKHGFTFNLHGFQSAMRRLRKKKAPKSSSHAIPAQTQSPASHTQASPQHKPIEPSPVAPALPPEKEEDRIEKAVENDPRLIEAQQKMALWSVAKRTPRLEQLRDQIRKELRDADLQRALLKATS